MMTAEEIEAICRSLLYNAAARDWAAAKAAPEAPGAEYLTGFAAGHEAGELAAFAFVLSMLSGASATALIDEARTSASVEAEFLVDLMIDGLSDEAA